MTILLVPAVEMPAQEYAVTRKICSSDGLSNDFVTEIAIDGQGYVWTATEAGVNRIAGNCSHTFQVTDWPPKGNSMQLVDNTRRLPGQEGMNNFGLKITALRWYKPANQMFIGTEVGMIIYDCRTGNIRFLSTNDGLIYSGVEDIVESSTGLWLLFNNGLVQHMNCLTQKKTELKQKKPMRAHCGMDDGMGNFYIGHNKFGMSIINIKTGAVRHFQNKSGDRTSLPGNNVRKIIKDSSGRIWVGTDRGMALFHPETGTFTKVTDRNDIYDDNVYDIYEMKDGTLWVATDMGGVRTLSPGAAAAQLYYDDTSIRLSSINTRAIAQDDYGNVWIGNHSTGVDFISAAKPQFNLLDYRDASNRPFPVYAITNDPVKGFWVANDNELSLWQDGKIIKRWVSQNRMRMKYFYPRSMIATRNGDVWIGVDDKGAVRFNNKTGSFEQVDIGSEDYDVHAFTEDSEGRVWLGTEVGIFSYSDKDGARSEAMLNKITGNSIVTCFLWLTKDVVFLCTYGKGCYVVNIRTGKAENLRMSGGLPSDRISQATVDGKGGVWIATHEGLVHVDDAMHLKGITVYNGKQGLADNHTCSVILGADGCVWMSTFSGISCLDSRTGRIYNYNHRNTGEACAFIGGGAISSEGLIYMCSASGVFYFNPLMLSASQKVSEAQIVSCEAYAPAGSDTRILFLSPDEDGSVSTSYQQNTLRLTFNVRNYAQTDHVEYSYMMKGMDDKWYYIDNDNDVVFRGLSPGHYTFVLRAKLKSQDWNDASVTEIKIHIRPPFWKTWWAYTLYGIALLIGIFFFVRSYKRRLALRNSLELEKRESMQRQRHNEERLHFFTNVTHELRTPLTLILGPLEDLMGDKNLPQSCQRRVGMIQKNAERLRNLINEVLEFRKTETQNRRLTVAKGDIASFISEICLNYKELYSNPKVQFNYSIQQNLPLVYFDSEVITTILNNFLSNAIKYTEHGNITTTVAERNGMIDITVADTGYGIAKEALNHIFDRYYQVEGSHQASGTGIGLALVKALAELHEAELHVDSQEGSGSTFTLSLNVANSYPDALHKEDVEGNAAVHSEQSVDTVEETVEETAENTLPTLLIIEDNADIREYIADSFCDDFIILKAENGEEGLKVAFENIPDIVVSDIMMPKMNGIELTKKLKEDIRTSHIPVILLTAKDTDDDKEEGYDSGADSYLTKPFTTKLLGSRIHNLLNTRRRLAEYISSKTVITRQETTETADAVNATEEQEANDVPRMTRLDREFIDRLNTVISENVMSEDLDLPFVTSKMAMSHSTFYRKVKALTGMTAKEYIRKFRLHHCYSLLESGDYNVTEAAVMTGFNQMAHFREVFKKEFGILPSEVKKK